MNTRAESGTLLDLSPHKQSLVTVSDAYRLQLWEVPSGRKISEQQAPLEHQVSSVRYSPDGRLIATASAREMTIRLWEAASGEQISVLHDGWHLAVFSPDGRTLLSTPDGGKTVRLQPFGQGLIDAACARVHALPLSDEDRTRLGIADEWCTREVSGALRAKLGLDQPLTDGAP